MKFTKSNLEKLEDIFVTLFYKVRYEKGNFNAGYCIVQDKKVVVINKFYDTEARINVLLDILSTLNVDETLFSAKTLGIYKSFLTQNFIKDELKQQP